MNTSRIVAKGIAFSLYQLHAHETEGPNKGEIVDELLEQAGGWSGLPWCASYADFVIDTACIMMGIPKLFTIGLSTSHIFAEGKKLGLVTKTPKDMDLCLLGNLQHTTLVWQSPDEKGDFWTIEGNSSDKVRKVKRNIKEGYIFVETFKD